MAAYTTIDNPELYFQVKTYTGTGSSNAITLDGDEDMQPDWVWIKKRNGATHHNIFDSVRGTTQTLYSNLNEGQSAESNALTAFSSDGFTVGSYGEVNNSSDTFVAWCWKAGNSSGSSNTDGSVTSTVSASTASGFSIAKFTGSGSNLTIGHGLGVKPDFIILKCTSSSSTDWTCYHSSLGATKRIKLNASDASSTNSTTWQDTEPTTSVISVGTSGDVNVSSGTHIVYSFANKQGAVKCGSYIGNGASSGSYIHLGFRPAWFLVKRSDSANAWHLVDAKRNTFNPTQNGLFPDTSDAENTGNQFDFLANGVKLNSSDGGYNASDGTYIYMAFAEAPFVNSNGAPCNAR